LTCYWKFGLCRGSNALLHLENTPSFWSKQREKIPLFFLIPAIHLEKLVISPYFSPRSKKAGELELTSLLRDIQTQTSSKSVILSVQQFYFCKLCKKKKKKKKNLFQSPTSSA